MERKEILHRLIAYGYSAIVIFTVSYLIYFGFDYYSTSIEERYFHDLNNSLKASGLLGHVFE